MELERFSWSWKFAEGHVEGDEKAVRKGAVGVDIPHNAVMLPYNCFDDRSYRRDFSYWKEFDITLEEGKKAILYFEAFMVQADIYVNGEKRGHYWSLYFPVKIDVTSFLKPGKNLIYLHLDAEEDPHIPPFGGAIDYLTYAGIYRPVHLEIVESCHIEAVRAIARQDGTVSVNVETSEEGGTLIYEIHDEKGLVVSSDKPDFKVDDVHVWDIKDPYLYELRVYLRKDGHEDMKSTKIGFRDIAWDKDGFRLNGKTIKLIGLNRHQAYAHMGYAVAPYLEELDAWKLKKEAGVNVVRTSHYMDSVSFLDECDRLGLLVIDEVPGWQFVSKDPEWRENYYLMVEKLAKETFNHPSVIAHGVRIDESLDDHELYTKGNGICRVIDPSRPTLGVRNITKSELLEDVYAYNDFYGEKNNKKPIARPKKVVGKKGKAYLVTEHNGHMNPTKPTDPYEQLISHARGHEGKINGAYEVKGVSGAIGWCFADYNTHPTFGSGDMVCAHGVFDMYRNPKPAAYVYAAQQEDFPVFELLTPMKTGEFKEAMYNEIPIATNCDYFELFKDGKKVGRFEPKGRKGGMPHPIYYLTEIIGDSLSDPRFKGKDKKRMASVLSDAAINGYMHLSFKSLLKAGLLILKYHLDYPELLGLYNKEISSWGGDGRGTTFEFVAYKDGKEFARRTFAPTRSLDYLLDCPKDELVNGNTYDAVPLTVKAVDNNGTHMRVANRVVEISVEGPVEVVGPDKLPLLGGYATFYVRSLSKAGEATVNLKIDRKTLTKVLKVK